MPDRLDTTYESVAALLAALAPTEPVYCVYPEVYERTAREFLGGFPGRVLYAVKANNHPLVVDALYRAGVRSFDCASLPEIALVSGRCPEATCYYMNPVRLAGAARAAYSQFGVRHFMVDHAGGIDALVAEIEPHECVIFARMAVSHRSAVENLSSKFGAPPDDMPAILDAIAATGAEPALAFNVGSGVTSPEAYAYAIDVARSVLGKLSYRVRLVDIGGGFPRAYPGYPVPPLTEFFKTIADNASSLPLADGGELLAEPGRALAAPGLSAVTQVLLRKPDRIYLNDGMYGAFWELRFDHHKRYPVRAWRDGRELDGPTRPFAVFGPTCDATDRLPEPVELPGDIRVGDWLEFGSIGAYSLSGRTDFNGFYSDRVVTIRDGAPPA